MAKVRPFDDRNTKEAIRLYKQGASVAELKAKYHSYGNPIVTRLKAAGIYKGPVAARKAAAKPAPRVKAGAPRANGTAKVNGFTSRQELVDSISRAVATTAFGNARFTPEPMTRSEIFSRIQDGVEQSVKKLKIGFHA